jgi:hypothetical protein
LSLLVDFDFETFEHFRPNGMILRDRVVHHPGIVRTDLKSLIRKNLFY